MTESGQPKSQIRKEKWPDVLKELQGVYLKDLEERLDQFSILIVAAMWDKTEQEFHKIKGTGKTYGYPEVSIIGEKLEKESKKKAPRSEMFELGLIILRNCLALYLDKKTPDLLNMVEFKKMKVLEEEL